MRRYQFIRTFDQIDKDDVGLVGGKGANLGEMTDKGLPVPQGFMLTAEAYFYFLKKENLEKRIRQGLLLVDKNDPRSYQSASQKVQNLITSSDIPREIVKEIFLSYEQLSSLFHNKPVAVRSSATAEDLPQASFAGQQATFLNVLGEANLIQKIRECWASLFTPRAIFYREEKGFDRLKVGIAVIVQKMIDSDISGVMFTLNPVTLDKKTFVIEAVWGLGELIVQGVTTPDHYEVDRVKFKITKKVIARQEKKLEKVGKKTQEVKIPLKDQEKQKISDKLIVQLAKLGKKIHQHYFYPQDIEWAVEKGKIYILQTRPVTTIVEKSKVKSQKSKVKISLPLIIKGDAASPGITTGYARIIYSPREIGKVRRGEILVTEMTTPDFVPAMRKVVAIVTNKGGQTSHAAIVSRELGLPCIVGTGKATRVIKAGQVITVNGKTGEVFRGGMDRKSKVKSQKSKVKEEEKEILSDIPRTQFPPLRTATKLYVNLAEPDLATDIAQRNVDGVGLLRAEFMIAQIGIHPKKLIADGKKQVFIDKLAEGLEKFCQAFDPRPVVYRATDFKTNEYANLVGGKAYEPKEPNPLLGFRGAYRYITNERVFALELNAIKKVRNKLGFRNLWLMIPYVRTVKEMLEVKRIITSHGLSRSPSFNLWMMVEIPSNIILLEDFIKVGLDGVSIGSNDLTMLILGLDRDNEEVAPEFDERNPAVLWALEKVIKTCKIAKVTSSICGQAPSFYPDLTQKLVSWGITSISVSPDMIEQTREIIYEAERRLIRS